MLDYYDNDSTSLTYASISQDDVVFGNNSGLEPLETSTFSYFLEFSDELFNGKQYGLRVSFNSHSAEYFDEKETDYGPGYPNGVEVKQPIKQELVFFLQSISKSYYLYLRTRSASMNMIDFLSEPVQIYSNVNGGIGIFGSYATAISRIELK